MAAIEELIEHGRKSGIPSGIVAARIAEVVEDPVWAKAIGHPTRAAIVRLLRRHGALSPTRAHEDEDLEGSSLGTVSYHFRRLRRLGLVELVESIPRRGAIEHVYQLSSDDGGRGSAARPV
jgi:DNA-binding transcriptional ArsR family regulator